MKNYVSREIYDEVWRRCQKAERHRDFLKHRVRELEEELMSSRRSNEDMARNAAQRRAAEAFAALARGE